ncbi:MAG TPA: adenine phosphoribosyltransferase [Solirubrobacteraceae bacterium]
MAPAVDLRSLIRAIPDFPSPGILFRDITPLLADPRALATAVDGLAGLAAGTHVDLVIGAEARGFILGPALAVRLGAGFVPARKPGRLPYDAVSASYELEYAKASLELHTDPVLDGVDVLVHDDLLATGGTARALCELVTRLGGNVVGAAFLIELADLGGRDQLPCPVQTLITYSG